MKQIKDADATLGHPSSYSLPTNRTEGGGKHKETKFKKSHEYPQFRDKHIEGVSKQPGEMVGIKTHDKCTPLWDSSIEKDRHHL